MIKIYGIYDHLALSPDVIIFMMHYCKEEIDRKYKGSRSPFIRYLENEAFEWYEEGIRDYDAAEKYVAEKRRKREKSEQYKKIFGISGRDYSPGEKKYARPGQGWALRTRPWSRAFDITVLNTGKLAWKYMGHHTEKLARERPPYGRGDRGGRAFQEGDPSSAAGR